MILYSCVSHHSVVLCQYGQGSYKKVVESMLDNITSGADGKTTYSSENLHFHCLVTSGMVYICAAKPDFSKAQAYTCLAEVERQFSTGNLLLRAPSSEALALQHDFSSSLKELMERFSVSGARGGATDHLSKLRAQVDDVKGIMTQNIEKVLTRGEKLEDLMDKTEDLEASAMSFQRTARRVRRKMFWKNRKMCIIICAVLAAIVLIIVIIILFSTGVIKT